MLTGQPGTSGATTSGTSSTPKPAQQQQQQQQQPNHNFAEADIKRLSDYGFPRQQVIEELQRANGNVDQALAALFAKSFQLPS